MSVTILTVATVASVGKPLNLVAHSTDVADSMVTWSVNVGYGVTFSTNPSFAMPGVQNFLTTMTVDPALAGARIAITATANNTGAMAARTIQFMQFFPDDDASHRPQLTMNGNKQVVEPGPGDDTTHSPDFTAMVKVWNTTLSRFVRQSGVEIRWYTPPRAFPVSVYDVTGGRQLTPISGLSGDFWYATATDSRGQSVIRVTMDAKISHLRVQAVGETIEDFKAETTFYTTLDRSNPIYSNLPQLGFGPFTDNIVSLDETATFPVVVPANLRIPDVYDNWASYKGWLEIDHAGDDTRRLVPRFWNTMADIPGTTFSLSDDLLDRGEVRNANTLGLFVQKTDGGSVFTYYPFSFTTVGSYPRKPLRNVGRNRAWLPSITDRNVDEPVNREFVEGHDGIPVEFTADFGDDYADDDYYVFFEWFLNNVDESKTARHVSPQSAQRTILKVVSGLRTYTDTLPKSLSMGYQGMGFLYVDFFLARSATDPEPIRIYSDWNRRGWLLSTL